MKVFSVFLLLVGSLFCCINILSYCLDFDPPEKELSFLMAWYFEGILKAHIEKSIQGLQPRDHKKYLGVMWIVVMHEEGETNFGNAAILALKLFTGDAKLVELFHSFEATEYMAFGTTNDLLVLNHLKGR